MGRGDKEKEIVCPGSETDSPFSAPVSLELEDHLDLHPFQPRDIPSVVEEYLEQCLQARFRQVRLIHGKGVGVQRNIVRTLLRRHAAVECFYDAPPEAGGWGATIVVLKSLP